MAELTEKTKLDFLQKCKDDPVFFVENLLVDEYGEPYILEEYQKEFLRCPARNRCLLWARRLSKSLMMTFDILHKVVFNRSFRALVISPSWEQSIFFGDNIVDLVERSPHIDPLFIKKNATTMRLENNSRIYMGTAGRSGFGQTGKGVSALFFDEASQISDEAFDFIRPTLRGQKHKPYIVFGGTPLARQGQFWNVYNDGSIYIKKEGVYEGEEDGTYVVFERRTAYLNDKGEIIESGTNRISLKELEEDRKSMSKTGFLREYALQWLDSIGEVFPQAMIDYIVQPDWEPEYRSDDDLIMGLDLGKKRFNSVLTIGRLKNNDDVDIINIIPFPLEKDYHDIASDVRRLQARYPNTMNIYIDETGVGKAAIETFERYLTDWRGLTVTGFDFGGSNKKKSLVEAGVMDLESGRIKMIHNESLISEMLEFKREITPRGNTIFSKPTGGSDDYVDSLLLCLAAAREYCGFSNDPGGIVVAGSRILEKGYSRGWII